MNRDRVVVHKPSCDPCRLTANASAAGDKLRPIEFYVPLIASGDQPRAERGAEAPASCKRELGRWENPTPGELPGSRARARWTTQIITRRVPGRAGRGTRRSSGAPATPEPLGSAAGRPARARLRARDVDPGTRRRLRARGGELEAPARPPRAERRCSSERPDQGPRRLSTRGTAGTAKIENLESA